MGSKNKSVSSSEKSQGGKDKAKKDKKDHSEKKEVAVFINEELVKNSKKVILHFYLLVVQFVFFIKIQKLERI